MILFNSHDSPDVGISLEFIDGEMKGTQGHSWKGQGLCLNSDSIDSKALSPQPLGIKLTSNSSNRHLQIWLIWSAFWLWISFSAFFCFYSLPWSMCLGINFSFLRCPPLLLSFSLLLIPPCHHSTCVHGCDIIKKGVGLNPASWAAAKEPDGASGSVCLGYLFMEPVLDSGKWEKGWLDRWLFPPLSSTTLRQSLFWTHLHWVSKLSERCAGFLRWRNEKRELVGVIHCPTDHHVFPFLASHCPSSWEPWACPSM